MSKQAVSRRQFLALSGGFTFLVSTGAIFSRWGSPDADPQAPASKAISAWIHLSEDGRITFFNPAAEMGQGSMTALAVIVAEEMDADWAQVQIEFSPIDPKVYGRSWGRSRRPGGTMLTVGSATVRGYYEALRIAGAQVRQVLMQQAAQHWGLPLAELHTEPSRVIHAASGRSLSYGEIAAFAEAPDSLPEISDEQLKKPEDFRLIGNAAIQRADLPAKVDGTAIYSLDIQLPNMVYAVITRAPVHGARPTLQNEAAMRALPGVIDLVRLDHGIGLVTDSLERALTLKPQLQIRWSEGAKAAEHDSEQAFETYPAIADDAAYPSNRLEEKGQLDQALQRAAKRYQADFLNDYAYHAQMEPLNAVVRLAEDGQSAELWVGTQGPEGARSAAARALGLDVSQVTLHPCYLGGGFGRRSMTDYVEEAALLAKAVRRPLKLLWTRADDVQYGAFRPMSLQLMEAGVDQSGQLIAWKHQIIGPGSRLLGSGARNPYYSIPHQLIEVKSVDHGIRTKHWRAVGHGPNKYAIEAFIDEIARDQGQDPYPYRRQLLRDDPRSLKVLDAAAEMANWGEKLPAGRARGISFVERSGSLSAAIAEISLNRQSGQLQVHKIWVALDSGVVVQPDNAIAQVEGSILMGLGNVLYERISFRQGAVQQSNYHDYSILKMADIPEQLEVQFLPSSEHPAGIGEAGLPNVGGMIANAFLALTGKKLRHMPFTPERVLGVLKG